MPATLKREDGVLIRAWDERLPRTNGTVRAELRSYDNPHDLVIWIFDENKWRILIAGPECERYRK